jgi:hypothetical protein
VSVRNRTAAPITVGVVKQGGLFDPAWPTPEEVAMRRSRLGRPSETAWDHIVVPPGKRGITQPMSGKFEPDANAVLRVYAGDLELSQVLAHSRQSPHRVDVVLPPGYSAFVITQQRGELRADPADEGPPE